MYRIDNIDGLRFMLEDGSWAVIRFSGTEPLLRIYVEASDLDRVDFLISEVLGLAGV